MYLGKIAILLFIASCISVNAGAIKRKSMKTKIKKTNLPKIVSPPCGCHNQITADIINCGCRSNPIESILGALDIGLPGCRGPIIEPQLSPIVPMPYPGCRGPVSDIEVAISGCKFPVIDIPNYRYAEPLELNPFACLFPSIEIPNYGVIPAPMTLPTVEYIALDLPCGCPGPQCGCRAPAVKLPAYPREYCSGSPMDIISYGPSVIEVPSYAPVVQFDGCRGPVVPACNCPGPCTCPSQSCGCVGSCSCNAVPISPCGCKSPCSCAEYQILSCGCQGLCSCPTIQMSPCGCNGPCGCAGMISPCGCPGPCSCPAIQAPVGLLPAIEVPYGCGGCGCGLPGCDCVKYLRQVTLQPPFL